MKAAVLTAFGRPLDVKNVPAPVMGTGEVIVDVVAAPVLSYTNEVLSGKENIFTCAGHPGLWCHRKGSPDRP